MVAVQKRTRAPISRERNKVGVNKPSKIHFAAWNFSLSLERKQTFTCHKSNQNCHTCVPILFWVNKKIYTHKRFRSDFVGALNNASAKLAMSFCLQSPCWFCWMRTEVADKWFAVVDRFAASGLTMIFVGQTAPGCWCILLFSARGFAMSWRNVNILVLLRRWSMFSSHTAYNFVALYVLPWMHFIAA